MKTQLVKANNKNTSILCWSCKEETLNVTFMSKKLAEIYESHQLSRYFNISYSIYFLKDLVVMRWESFKLAQI